MTKARGLSRLLPGGARADARVETEDQEDDEVPEEDEEEQTATGEGDEEDMEEGEDEEEGSEASAAGERARIAAILGSKEAKGRSKLAQKLALETDLSVKEARSVLSAGGKEDGGLAGKMASTRQPNLGSGGGRTSSDETVESKAQHLAGIANGIDARDRQTDRA